MCVLRGFPLMLLVTFVVLDGIGQWLMREWWTAFDNAEKWCGFTNVEFIARMLRLVFGFWHARVALN